MKGKSKYGRLKKFLVIFLIFILAFVVYVEVANRNSKQMTYRQKVLKAVYPIWMWFSRSTGKHKEQLSSDKIPPVSFYSLKARLINGDSLDFNSLRGKKVMLVNTASECGYTDQYRELQKMHEKYGLLIIGFPANDFKGQEPGTNEEIAKFCKVNYGVTFPLAEKSTVKKGPEQHPVFHWLTDPGQNGWNSKEPGWNFSKYLIDENGSLTNYFGSSISPGSQVVRDAILKKPDHVRQNRH